MAGRANRTGARVKQDGNLCPQFKGQLDQLLELSCTGHLCVVDYVGERLSFDISVCVFRSHWVELGLNKMGTARHGTGRDGTNGSRLDGTRRDGLDDFSSVSEL